MTYTIDDSDWEIPAFQDAVFKDMQHPHALVIPVINEGDRIRGQLLRVQAANLPVDVIVADGGSTDGSLESGFVQSAGVRAILTKTGPGQAERTVAHGLCLVPSTRLPRYRNH